MEYNKIINSVSQIRRNLKYKQQKTEINAPISRKSSFSETKVYTSQEIPKNTFELLQRYGNSRIKMPSYKLDAVELICSIINRPIRRYFFEIKKNEKTNKREKRNSKFYESVTKFYENSSADEFVSDKEIY